MKKDDIQETPTIKPEAKNRVQRVAAQPDQNTEVYVQDMREQHIVSLKHDNHKKAEEILQLKSDRTARKWYGMLISCFVLVYLMLAAVLVVFQATLRIHDPVMIAFLATTVVNTIGLMMGVVRYLFQK